MKVTNAAATPQSLEGVRGRVVEPGLIINPADGLPTVTKSTFVAFCVDDVATIAGVDETYEGWVVEFTSPGGEAKKGRLEEPVVNRTFGYISSSIVKKD